MKIVKKIECSHKENRMENEGNILKAREYFFSKKNKNLYFLLKNRYEWINKFVNKLDNTIELGSGACFLKKFVTNNNIKTSDLSNYEFLDYKKIDATNTNFPDNEFDKVISSNLIHHIAYPIKHFEEVYRILKPNGLYIIQDIHCSIMCQLAVMLTRHEGFDFTKDITNNNIPCNNPDDLWSANIAIPNLVFDDFGRFNEKLNFKFQLIYKNYSEFLSFLNSGGVIAKTKYFPLNNFFNKLVQKIDKIFVKFPNMFALQTSIVSRKKENYDAS